MSERHWTDKSNERVKGDPLSRVPEWGENGCERFDYFDQHEHQGILGARLEEALLRIDRLEAHIAEMEKVEQEDNDAMQKLSERNRELEAFIEKYLPEVKDVPDV